MNLRKYLLICMTICSIMLFPRIIFAQPLEYDTDRPGMDYRSFDLSSADPKICEEACKKDGEKCKSFTYVKPGVQGRNARCYLKSAVPPPRSNACCVSGVQTIQSMARMPPEGILGRSSVVPPQIPQSPKVSPQQVSQSPPKDSYQTFKGQLLPAAEVPSPPKIQVIFPTETNSLIKNKTYVISWTSNLPATTKVRIDLFENGSLKLIISPSTANNGSYAWTIPNSLNPTITGFPYRVRVTADIAKGWFAEGNLFRIVEPYIEVSSASEPPWWCMGRTYHISWRIHSASKFSSVILRIYNSITKQEIINKTLPCSIGIYGDSIGAYDFSVPGLGGGGTFDVEVTTPTGAIKGKNVGFQVMKACIDLGGSWVLYYQAVKMAPNIGYFKGSALYNFSATDKMTGIGKFTTGGLSGAYTYNEHANAIKWSYSQPFGSQTHVYVFDGAITRQYQNKGIEMEGTVTIYLNHEGGQVEGSATWKIHKM